MKIRCFFPVKKFYLVQIYPPSKRICVCYFKTNACAEKPLFHSTARDNKLWQLQLNSANHLAPCGKIICMKQKEPAGKHGGKNSCYCCLETIGNSYYSQW